MLLGTKTINEYESFDEFIENIINGYIHEDIIYDIINKNKHIDQYIYDIKDLLNIEKNFIKEYIYDNYITYVKDIINVENEINSLFMEKEQNLNIDIVGYLYIIKTIESIRMKENIYKIGCTNNINMTL